MNSFLTQHIKKAQQLNRGFFLLNWGRHMLTTVAFIALLACHASVATWLYGSYNFPLSMVVFMSGIYLLANVSDMTQSAFHRWCKKRGYMVVRKFHGPKLVTPSARTVDTIYNNFIKLPNTLEHALLEKHVRAFKNRNRLPHSWWRELDEHVCKTLNIAVVKIEDTTEHDSEHGDKRALGSSVLHRIFKI